MMPGYRRVAERICRLRCDRFHHHEIPDDRHPDHCA